MSDIMSERSKQHDSSVHDLWSPDGSTIAGAQTLACVLRQGGHISLDLLDAAERVHQQTPDSKLHMILLDMGADETAVMRGVASMHMLTYVDIDANQVDQELLSTLGHEFCMARHVLPVRSVDGRPTMASIDPHDINTMDEIRSLIGDRAVRQTIANPSDIIRALDQEREQTVDTLDLQQLLADVAEDDVSILESAEEDEEDDGSASPVVRYVNHVIQSAVQEGASDIHIEPSERSLKIRFRIDGVLYETMNPPRRMLASITSRIKIMAGLGIAERRLPQDGRIRVEVLNRAMDLRVSTAPTPHGEKTVMRILDNRSIQVPLDDLGFEENTLDLWRDQIAQPHGILLVTGPTGSGKTTTLYASMQELDLQRLNVSTVEDPVEYQMRGITQMQTHDRIGLSFSSSLRTLLRQDPDVIMVGEIRDQETATIAIQAAMTGHLVLSTLHTNDAPSSITRLINIGIEPFLVSSAVNAVLAQRLVRRVCDGCVTTRTTSREEAEILDRYGYQTDSLHIGTGCNACRQTGLAGRVGIHEMLTLNESLRDHIAASPTVTSLRQACLAGGMTSLRHDALKKMLAGHTTIAEVLRVTSDG